MASAKMNPWPYLLIFLIALLCSRPTVAQGPLTLGVHPYLPATELVDRFTPLANYLSKKIDRPITVEIAKNYQTHIDQTGKDQTDIAYMGPAPYVRMVDQYGKKPVLARLEINKKSTFQGIIIVRQDSPFQTLADLGGKHFAFGDPNSTMSHLVPRYMLWKADVLKKLASSTYLHNHHNVALGVLIGEFDAGAVKEEVFYQYRQRGLKELTRTPLISEHLFVAKKSLPPEKVEALRNALYQIKNDKEGPAIMTAIKKDMTGLVPAADKDYDNLREILHTLKQLEIQ